MRLNSANPLQDVIDFDDSSLFSTADVSALRLELVIWWGNGLEPTRAIWRWRGTRKLAAWVDVGEA